MHRNVSKPNEEEISGFFTVVILKNKNSQRAEDHFSTPYPKLSCSEFNDKENLRSHLTSALNNGANQDDSVPVDRPRYFTLERKSIFSNIEPFYYNENCASVYLIEAKFPKDFILTLKTIKQDNGDILYELPHDFITNNKQILKLIWVYQQHRMYYCPLGISLEGKLETDEVAITRRPAETGEELLLQYGTDKKITLKSVLIKHHPTFQTIFKSFENESAKQYRLLDGSIPLYGKNAIQHFGGEDLLKLVHQILVLAAIKQGIVIGAANSPLYLFPHRNLGLGYDLPFQIFPRQKITLFHTVQSENAWKKQLKEKTQEYIEIRSQNINFLAQAQEANIFSHEYSLAEKLKNALSDIPTTFTINDINLIDELNRQGLTSLPNIFLTACTNNCLTHCEWSHETTSQITYQNEV